MAGGSDLVVTYHCSCWAAGLGWQDTQALNLNPIFLLAHLNFLFLDCLTAWDRNLDCEL